MAFDKKLLDIIACPVCKGKLEYNKDKQQLICKVDRLVYAINDGIPVLLENKAEPLEQES
ncbi:Trm112 family protein [Shewanella waksmanii]|uniref:Trm112 family protein n=1 Tax=Shewanella waksmanii TaxID=213783 RepID=UPI003734FABC